MGGSEAIRIIEKLGVSQRQFAFMVGMHPNAISRWASDGNLSGPAEALLALLDARPELIHLLKERHETAAAPRGKVGKRK